MVIISVSEIKDRSSGNDRRRTISSLETAIASMNYYNVKTSENAKEKRSSAATAIRGTSAIVPRMTRPNLRTMAAMNHYGPPRSPSTWSVTTYGPNGPPNTGTPRSLYNHMMNYHSLIPPPSYTATRAIQYASPPPLDQIMKNACYTLMLQYSRTATPDNRNSYNNNASSSQLISRDMMPPLMPSLLTEQRDKLNLFEQMRPTRGTPMMMECVRGGVRIRFCSTCNALWPPTGVPASHKSGGCSVTKMFPENCIPQFECNKCSIRLRLDDIGVHVAGAYHYMDIDELTEPSLSCLCAECNTIMYTPWSVFVEHRRKAHSKNKGDSFLDKQEMRIPMVMVVMRWMILDYLKDGRRDLLYVCLMCKHFGTDPCNVRKPCNICNNTDNKFYCEHCNAVFSCMPFGYDIHRLTFEHFYLMQNRQYMANRLTMDENNSLNSDINNYYFRRIRPVKKPLSPWPPNLPEFIPPLDDLFTDFILPNLESNKSSEFPKSSIPKSDSK